jgi:hypothetical protein
MAIDFSALIYSPCMDVFARPITVTAIASRAGAVYSARGKLDTRGTVIMTDAGAAVISDQETILDIRERDPEFGGIPPAQGDVVDIPADGAIIDGVGTYEVTDAAWNGGGEITLVLRKMTTPTVLFP